MIKAPSLERDFWMLDYSKIDPHSNRELFENSNKLKRGDAVKLNFVLMPNEENKEFPFFLESMWVVITKKFESSIYMGVLVDSPELAKRGKTDYLIKGAEIPFHQNCITDIQFAPSHDEAEAYIAKQTITKTWPRN